MATEVTIKTNKVTAVQNKLTTAMKAATNLMNALSTIDTETLKEITNMHSVDEICEVRMNARNAMDLACDLVGIVASYNASH